MKGASFGLGHISSYTHTSDIFTQTHTYLQADTQVDRQNAFLTGSKKEPPACRADSIWGGSAMQLDVKCSTKEAK